MEKRNIYIIGIEGAGTSALAILYKKNGFNVAGSDEGDHFYADALKANGISVFDKYNQDNINEKYDWIVFSTSVKKDNPEMLRAEELGITLLSYPEALARLFNEKMGIAVCGTHGKTTTTAMLATTMEKIGLDPSAVVGSKVNEWSANGIVGKSDYFIIEADEYQNKLQYYEPWSVILTSVDYDHPDYYATFEEYKKAFSDFVEKIPSHGFLAYCNDSSSVIEVAVKAACQKVSYGFSNDSDYKITLAGEDLRKFEVTHKEESLGIFEIKFPGRHNIFNACAVVALCNEMNLDIEAVKKALEDFKGTARRFELVGEKNGSILIDDYAHHPEEIRTTLRTIKEIHGDKNIITVFHPHSFSRTEALLSEFSQSFENTNDLIVLDIYGSAREESGAVSSENLVNLVNRYDRGKAVHIATIDEVIKHLENKIGKNDIVVSMGAGDVWRVTHALAGKI